MAKTDNKAPRRRRAETPFSQNLTVLLKERKISLRAAAQLAGVSVSTISDWCAGSAPADLTKVAALARAFNVSFSKLCLGEEESRLLEDIPLEEIFETESTYEGLFKLTAVKLVRRKKKQKGEE